MTVHAHLEPLERSALIHSMLSIYSIVFHFAPEQHRQQSCQSSGHDSDQRKSESRSDGIICSILSVFPSL